MIRWDLIERGIDPPNTGRFLISIQNNNKKKLTRDKTSERKIYPISFS